MVIRIVTDSTCDLPASLIKLHAIKVIPLYIIIGDMEFHDRLDISRKEFYEQLPGMHPLPTTATPGPDTVRKTYEQLVEEGATEILSIHVSVSLSAIVDIARQAAQLAEGIPVTVFDSRQLSLGTGFLVLTAAQAAAQGKSIPEIIQLLEDQIARTHVFAALDTLEYLRRSGRMNAAVSMLGEILKIKPLLRMYNGKAIAERVRTRNGARKRLIELLKEAAPFEKIALIHSNAVDIGKEILAEITPLFANNEILFQDLTPILGSHLGPGVVGFACVTRK